MPSSDIDVFGLFPAIGAGSFGGVQASGREAWEAILDRFGEERSQAFYYRAGSSKASAVVRAIRNRRSSRIILVWHLHLLKLLPFLDHSQAQVILFLHGIECWLTQDSVTQRLLRRVHLVLSNSDHTWAQFLVHNPEFQNLPHRTVPLGMGTQLEIATPAPSGTPAVLMVGRLDKSERYKGHEQTIEAWPKVLAQLPAAELWIVGGGNLQPALAALARERAPQSSIRFFGQISDAEKERLIASCRCFALPSRGEGFGLVYLEAMRLGRPCLVGNADAGREVIEPPEAGLAVDPDDPTAIADALIRILTAPHEWAQWSDRARRRYESLYTGRLFHQRLLAALPEN